MKNYSITSKTNTEHFSKKEMFSKRLLSYKNQNVVVGIPCETGIKKYSVSIGRSGLPTRSTSYGKCFKQ